MRFWFGRKSAPETMTCAYAPPAWLAGGSEEGFVRGYEAQLGEVYRHNPVGLRAVRLVAGAIGGLTVEAEQTEAAKLAKPVLEGVGAALLLHGNAYVQLIADSHGNPRELALLRPERVSIATDERGQPCAYVYRIRGKAVRIAARDALHRRQVAHVRALNPADDHLGLGCLDAAIGAASVHNRASRWNKALLDNAARPSGALSYEPSDGSNLSGEQFDRLKAELAEQFAGAMTAPSPPEDNPGLPGNRGLLYSADNSHFFKTGGGTFDASSLCLTINASGLNMEAGKVGGDQIVGPRGAAVANATDAASAITQLNALLARCRAHGLIASRFVQAILTGVGFEDQVAHVGAAFEVGEFGNGAFMPLHAANVLEASFAEGVG